MGRQLKSIALVGTELKININIEPIDNKHMSEYDWTAHVYCNSKASLNLSKSDAIKKDDDNYIILIDTSLLGTGDLKCKLTAYIPDADFIDGLRTEIVGINTGITIVKHF